MGEVKLMEHTFIGDLIRGKAHVRLITVNGFQMTGRIKDQDDRAVLIKEDGGGREAGV